MEKYMKLIMVLIFPFLLLGCSADYTLTIDNNSYKEEVKINYSDSQEEELMYSQDWTIPTDYDEYVNGDDYNGYTKDPNLEYYNYIKESDGIKFTYGFDLSNIFKSTAMNKCFDSARVISNNDQVIITTSSGCKCFNDDLRYLTIRIVVKDKLVLNNNADQVIDNEYIWNINQNNYKTKAINMTMKNSVDSMSHMISTSNNDKNSLLKNYYIDTNLLIFCVIFLVLGGIGVLIYTKIKKDDI